MRNHNNQIVVILSLLFVVFNCGVNTQESDDIPAELQPHNQPSHRNNPQLTRAKRMYALCPPDFQKIGNDCFYMSKKKYNWLDAHFECKDRNSKLAEPMKFADRRLRKYLQNRDEMLGEKWIGGMYNHQQNKWKWGYNGGEMKYQAFDDGVEGSNLEYHCTVMDPHSEYKWTARKCTELHYFICQHRMSLVNEKQRQRVYTKWNETYPNQMANEVEVYVSTNGNNNNRSQFYRKRNRSGINRLSQVNNEVQKAETTSSTLAPDYLPYNVYSKLETFEQKPQEDIHPINSATNVGKELDQESLKQRKRHSLKLSGDVDLGLKKKKRTKGKKIEKKNQVDEIVPPQQSLIDENNKNDDSGRQHQHHKHHHHNHHHHPNNALPETEVKTDNDEEESKPIIELKPVLEFLTSPPEPVERTTASTTTTSTTVSSSTVGPAIIERTTMSELRKKLEEKAQRRERLKEKLAKLSPEERQAFLLMKQQRADARKKGFKIGSSSSS